MELGGAQRQLTGDRLEGLTSQARRRASRMVRDGGHGKRLECSSKGQCTSCCGRFTQRAGSRPRTGASPDAGAGWGRRRSRKEGTRG